MGTVRHYCDKTNRTLYHPDTINSEMHVVKTEATFFFNLAIVKGNTILFFQQAGASAHTATKSMPAL